LPGAGTDKTKRWIEQPAPIVVLVEPQLGENIGMAARAMGNFGLTRLRIVNPRDGWPNVQAQRAASGADLDVPAGTVWDLISAVAQQRPDALALVDDDARMTYRELVERVDALAADLMRHGAGPGRLIGVCIQRSINMVIGLLAILRSGAAYVPIDPSYPKLAGQYADYLDAALKAYQTDGNPHIGRNNAIMMGMARPFTHPEIKAIAGYISSLPSELQTVAQARFR